MEPILWIVFFAVLLIVIVVGRKFFSSDTKNGIETNKYYIQALESLAGGGGIPNEAIQLLKKSIETNPSSFAPYLLLGDLLRKKGDVGRSLKLHKELSLRPNLSRDQLIMVLKSLVKDQIALRVFGDAVSGCEKILNLDKKDRETHEILLTAYEGQRMWDEAIEVSRKFARFFLTGGKAYQAYYLSYIARQEMKEDREAAKKKLRKALSLDPSCQSAQVFLGDVYYEEKDFDKAIEIWSNFLKNNPEAIKELASRLEKAYFEEGQFGRMVEVYENLSHDLPGNPDVLIGLSRMYHKKGELDAALRLATEAKDLDSKNPEVYRTLVELYHDKKNYEPLLSILKEYFEEKVSAFDRSDCGSCGYSSEELFWRCPQCGTWQVEFQEKVQ